MLKLLEFWMKQRRNQVSIKETIKQILLMQRRQKSKSPKYLNKHNSIIYKDYEQRSPKEELKEKEKASAKKSRILTSPQEDKIHLLKI